MKKVINGKVYNTETATLVAEWSNHYFPRDFHYCEEELYLTKKGNWFIAGQGGALSKYAQPCGNGSCGGEGIEPISEAVAKVWLEHNDCILALEEYFGDQLEEA